MMFCPDCNTNLDAVPVDDPCPGCGGKRRSAVAYAEVARAVATAPPVTAVGHSHLADGTEVIEVGSEGYRSASRSGPATQRFEGSPPQGEEDVLQVCKTLRAALRHRGEEWSAFQTQPPPVDDVDAFASDDLANLLEVQVTRVERQAWSDLAQRGASHAARSETELAQDIATAIEGKSKRYSASQRARLVLALDARRSPGHVHRSVVDRFLEAHADIATTSGYRAIWLVGPTSDLTYQLV
jgi:hypothetical protein